MPIYTFKHPKGEYYVDIIQGMNDVHEYIDKKGVKYERVFHKPNASIDSNIDPFSKKDFVNKTNKKGLKVGDLWDISGEMSEKRKQKAGKDEVKEKAINDYKKKCKGAKHPFEN